MAESSCRPRMVDGDGAAKRRRQRRLRSWLRHEQQTVAAVLATVSHHSYPKVDTAHDGLRALRTVTSTREGVEHEKHVGPRAQKPHLPGVRPGSLLDPGPQRSDRTVRHSAGEAPLLVVASLAGGDEVDATTVSFLLLGQGYQVHVSFTFRGGDEALEKFSVEAPWVMFFMLAGHRSVDGCRVSLYNGLSLERVEALCSFMKSFLVAGFAGDDTSRAAYSGRARRRLAMACAWLVC